MAQYVESGTGRIVDTLNTMPSSINPGTQYTEFGTGNKVAGSTLIGYLPNASGATAATSNPSSISASGLTGKSPVPLGMPSSPSSTYAVPSIDTLLSEYSAPSAAESSASGDISSILASIKGITDKQGTQSAETARLNETYGVNDLNSQLTEINSQIKTLNAQTSQAKIDAEGRLAPTFAITGEQAQIDRQASFKMLGLSAAASALTGQLSLAQDKVTQAISAEFDPLKSELTYAQTALTVAQDNMSAAQKEKATALTAALDERSRVLDQQQSDKTTIYNTMLTAAKNGAPNTVINAILNSSTPDAAAQAAGTYLTATKGAGTTYKTLTINGQLYQYPVDPSGKALGAPTLVGSQDTASATPPDWFKTQYESQHMVSATPEALQTAWDAYKQQNPTAVPTQVTYSTSEQQQLIGAGIPSAKLGEIESYINQYGLQALIDNSDLTDAQVAALKKIYGVTS